MSFFTIREGVEATLRAAPPLAVIDMEGELTTATEPQLRKAHAQAVEQGAPYILLNFGGVTYLNSSGIAVVISFLSEARESERHIYFTGLTPHFQKIFRVMGLTQYGTWVDTEDEAKRLAAERDAAPPAEA